MKYLYLVLGLICFTTMNLSAQEEQIETPQDTVIQFAGYVVTEGSNGDVVPLPYTSVSVVGTSRGTTCNEDGYFSFVAVKGETIMFTRIGFRDVKYTIPDTLQGQFFSYVQIMSETDELLPEAVIYPWPDKEFFEYEFLAMDISNELRTQAQKNLAREVLEKARHTVPIDGREAMKYETDRRVTEYRYMGQYKPQRIFDPLAWAKFIKAWRNGDFKKKKKKKK